MPIYDYGFPVQYVQLEEQLELAYFDEGNQDGSTILFIHGLGSNIRAYEKLIGLLAKDFRCIAVDLPNYGQSSIGNFPMTMDWLTDVLRRFVAKLAIGEFILAGHSMGGQLSIHFALMHPTWIKSLLLFAPAGFERFTTIERQYLKGIYNPLIIKSLSVDQIRKNFHLNFHVFPADAQFMIEDRLKLRKTKAYDSFCKMIPKCVAGMLDAPVFDQLPQLSMSTLVIYGLNDQLIPNPILHNKLTTRDIAYQGFKQIKKGHLVLLPNCGHFLIWEQATGIKKAIQHFLKPN